MPVDSPGYKKYSIHAQLAHREIAGHTSAAADDGRAAGKIRGISTGIEGRKKRKRRL
jgi:hypothetical protein